MGSWAGHTSLTAHVGGRNGRHVRLGDSLVPPKVTFEFTGDNGEPDVTARFAVVDGRPECVDFHVATKEGGRGIRTADLTLFNLDAMTANVFAEVAMSVKPERTIPASDENHRRAHGDVMEARQVQRGPSHAELDAVAQVYREHVDSAPTSMVAQQFGYSERTAARRVQQAREHGLLPKTTRGKRKA
jgi:hypothetical protein